MGFNFTPTEGLLNQVSFPSNPASETEARNQFMVLFNQIKDYINNTIEVELNKKVSTAKYDEGIKVKQNSNDNSLQTTNKTIPGAINELNQKLTDLKFDNPTNNIVPIGNGYYLWSNSIVKSNVSGINSTTITLPTGYSLANFPMATLHDLSSTGTVDLYITNAYTTTFDVVLKCSGNVGSVRINTLVIIKK